MKNQVDLLQIDNQEIFGDQINQELSEKIAELSCHICGYVAPTQHYAEIHLRKHTGEKPHFCPICPFRSSQRSNITSHLENHDGCPRKRKCPYCSYSTNGALLHHIKLHEQ